jgi:hypothetical protein
MTARETPPWGDMDRDAYIAQIVQTGWTEINTAFDGKVFRHGVAADDAGLTRTTLFAKKSAEVHGFTWKASVTPRLKPGACRSSNY